MKKYTHTLLTFYKFVDIADPKAEVAKHFQFCNDIGMKGRIYIGEEGISATATCTPGQLQAYKLFLDSNPYFRDIEDFDVKATKVTEHAFPRMVVKYRKEIVALGKVYNAQEVHNGGKRLAPEELKDIIDTDNKDRVILDMRNSYEYKLGHFKNAIPAGTVNFRELENVIETYKEKFEGKKILTYCTGGIRCEKATVMLRDHGMDNVYQLQGGVVKYINTHNDGNWLGNLYTFDGLVSTPVGDKDTHTKIGKCIYTGYTTDNIENCRYTECNARIICRKKAYKQHGGFCSLECFETAKKTMLVKNDSFDSMDYQALRSAVKAGKKNYADAVLECTKHLDELWGNVKFPYETSQKEEYIDSCMLQEYV